METSNNNATSSPAATGPSRRSGRVSKVPDKFIPDAPAAAKRKRRDDNDDDDVENDAHDTSDDESDAEADDTADNTDNDEIEEAPRRKKKSSQPPRSRKPAAKKPKINGNAAEASDHPVRLASRPKKTVRIAIERREGDGLFGKSHRQLQLAIIRVVLTVS
jgi:cohesin complex subunit SA-1/2